MENLVQHTFHMYDGLVADLGVAKDAGGAGLEQEHGQSEEGVRPPEHGRNVDNNFQEEEHIPHMDVLEEAMPDDDMPAMEQERATQHQLLEDSARTPLFPGSRLTQLGGTLFLLNCLQTHGASNQLFNDIFAILSKSMLPKVNSLLTNEYHASKVLKQLGLAYNTIHCCL